MAITQIRNDGPGRDYYHRKRASGKSHKEALRCLKRRLSDAVYRQLLERHVARESSEPGRTTGGDYELQRGRHKPQPPACSAVAMDRVLAPCRTSRVDRSA